MVTARYQVHPATAERWDDLVDLFGEDGAYGGCWCMWFRFTGQEFREHRGEGNRRALEGLVRDAGDGDDGRPAPGLLAYDGGLAVGWCALAPRTEYRRLARSPVAKPVDDAPAWAVTCFFVRMGYRGRGVASALLEAATAYAIKHGAEIVEGYPVDFTRRQWNTAEAYYGTATMFERAGYTEVARRSPSRPFMRYHADRGDRLRRLAEEVRALPVLDDRDPDEVIGYDERGLP